MFYSITFKAAANIYDSLGMVIFSYNIVPNNNSMLFFRAGLSEEDRLNMQVFTKVTRTAY